MAVVPSFDGFNEAMSRLHDLFDAEVIFHIPPAPGSVSYPEGTAFDPQTQMPMDPTVEPTSGGGETDVPKRAGIIHRVGAEDETQSAAPGRMESAPMILTIPASEKPDIEDATTVTVYGERQAITEMRPDAAFNSSAPDRWLIFLEGA